MWQMHIYPVLEYFFLSRFYLSRVVCKLRRESRALCRCLYGSECAARMDFTAMFCFPAVSASPARKLFGRPAPFAALLGRTSWAKATTWVRPHS